MCAKENSKYNGKKLFNLKILAEGNRHLETAETREVDSSLNALSAFNEYKPTTHPVLQTEVLCM
jgi:hypothetical protein